MKKGTRFQVVGPLDSFDRERGIRIGDTGVVLTDSDSPWCKMDKDTSPGWWQEPGNPDGGLHGRARDYGTSVKRLACLTGTALAPIAQKAPRKSPKLQETSLQAHKSQKDKAPLDRVAILARLRKYRTGTTCDKLEQALNMSHQTTSARINDLVQLGKVVDSGRREKTRTGRRAICWKAVA